MNKKLKKNSSSFYLLQDKNKDQSISAKNIVLEICFNIAIVLGILRLTLYLYHQDAVIKFISSILNSLPNSIVKYIEILQEPLGWALLGLFISQLLRSKLLRWNAINIYYKKRSVHKKKKKFKKKYSEEETELMGYDVELVENDQENFAILKSNSLPDGEMLGEITDCLEFSFEEIIDVYYRKYKKPFPDPALKFLVEITLEVDKHYPKWNCTFRRRHLKLRNAAPAFLKKFANEEFITFVEDTLIDHHNKVFHIRSQNKSLENLGSILEISQYKFSTASETSMVQSGKLQLGNSFGLVKGMIVRSIREKYQSELIKNRDHFIKRLEEEKNKQE